MRISARYLMAWVAVALCLCVLPTDARAENIGGTLLSKGLDYDDAYGVVNGNALMQKVVGDSPEGEVSELDLVSSSGEVLFRTGFTEGIYGQYMPNSTYRYMPAYDFGKYGAFGDGSFESNFGEMLVNDNATGKQCFVNHQGDIVISDVDDILVIESLERILTASLVDSHINFRLFDVGGNLIDSQSGYYGVQHFVGMQENNGVIELSMDYNKRAFATVDNEKIVLHEEPIVDPGLNPVIFERGGYKVELVNGALTFVLPSGLDKTIDKGFSYAILAWNNEGSDVGISASVSGEDSPHFYLLDGTEIFVDKQYGNVTKLPNVDAYLCFRYSVDQNSHEGKSEYWIDSLESNSIASLDTEGETHYEVVGGYIVGRQNAELDLSSYPYLTKILDYRGSVLKTFKPQDRWALSVAPYHMSQDGEHGGWLLNDVRYLLKQERIVEKIFTGKIDKTCLLDENLTTVAEFDGWLDFSAGTEVDGNSAFPLTLIDNAPWIPNGLYDTDVNPLMFYGKQRVNVKGAYQRDSLSYVTDGNDRYGALDHAGNAVIPVVYEAICDLGEDRDDSVILVRREGEWYFMDLSAESPQAPAFSDVNLLTTPHAEDIIWLANNGISKGWEMPNGTYQFRPYADVTRCDMAAFLYRLAGSPKFEPTDEQRRAFIDVDASTPHSLEVWWLAAQGISKGWDNSDETYSFRPYDTIKRCDMAAFLYRLAGEPDFDEAAGNKFSDVVDSTPHRRAIKWMHVAGVAGGWTNNDGTLDYRPYVQVARCDMAAFLCRMNPYV